MTQPTNDALTARMIVGSPYDQRMAASELTRRGIDVDRLRWEVIPLYAPRYERPARPVSRRRHRSSFQSVTRSYPDGMIETAVRWDFDSEYEDY